jgi:threonine/homoserine/homoserine lactone efflux protein
MSSETWLLFVFTEGALCFTPGPAVLLVLSQGLTRGARASILSNLGILTGNAFYFALSATGVGAILMTSYELFSLIKWVGAAYLVWLGVMAFTGRAGVLEVATAATHAGATRTFWNGVVLQVANPKALLFFTALLPPFIDRREVIVPQVAILGATSVVLEFVVLLLYGALAGRLTSLATRPRFQTVTNRLAGTMLVTAGVSVARIERT